MTLTNEQIEKIKTIDNLLSDGHITTAAVAVEALSDDGINKGPLYAAIVFGLSRGYEERGDKSQEVLDPVIAYYARMIDTWTNSGESEQS